MAAINLTTYPINNGLPTPEPVAAPNASAPVRTEAEEMKMREGHLWNHCSKRIPSPEGGFIYRFELGDEFNPRNYWGDKPMNEIAAIEMDERYGGDPDKENNLPLAATAKKNEEISPAIESGVLELWMNGFFHTDRAEALGFRLYEEGGKFHLELPDAEALSTRWEAYRNSHPELNLPPLKIKSSEGIAGDLEFAQAFIDYDVLLSNGKEFIHDHLAHIIPTLMTIFLVDIDTLGPGKPRNLKGPIGPGTLYLWIRDSAREALSKYMTPFVTAKEAYLNGKLPFSKERFPDPIAYFTKMERAFGELVDSHTTQRWMELSEDEIERYLMGSEGLTGEPLDAFWKEIRPAATA